MTDLKATSLPIFALSRDGILFWRPSQFLIIIIAGTSLTILDRLSEKIISGAVAGRTNSRGLTGEEGWPKRLEFGICDRSDQRTA